MRDYPVIFELKTWPEPFQMVLDGRKRFELRRNDREDGGYQVGDELTLREYSPAAGGCYTGRSLVVRITCVVTGWGLEPGHVALGIEPIGERD